MSNVIRFLETMGSDASMARMSVMEYHAAVTVLGLDEEQSEGLFRRNSHKIGDYLGVKENFLCLVFSPSEEQPNTPDQESETPEKEAESE